MTVLEFLRTAPRYEIEIFIDTLLSCCECGVSECPLEKIAFIPGFDSVTMACNAGCIANFLDCKIKRGVNENEIH